MGDRKALAEPAGNRAGHVAERRVTSILFADLVGFTPFAEQLDPEEVRDVLSEYFHRCRETIANYGGTVEKFIGDAVMAVWGVPTAHEDDAERAVRCGLDLIERVVLYGQQVGATGLQLRVGIATGEVAVTVGAVGEGMVSGDAVNTASRVQAQAAPGQVWVEGQTAHLTSGAITYEDQGEHQLKGKTHPLRLQRAVSVLSAHGSGPLMDQLTVALTGYGSELARIKDVFHATVDDGRGRLLLLVGEPGVGKTRLALELRTYLDGLTTSIYWHWGECLTYGEGIVYAALVHAVHHKLGTTDADSEQVIRGRIGAVLQEQGATEQEQAWLEPRLGLLLGVATGTFGREDLFAAWLAWFELLGRDGSPLVWVVEDAHHADEGLLEFMEFLARTASVPVMILALARPELLDRRPRFGTGRRMTQLNLEGLNDEEMGSLIDALVEDLPTNQRDLLVHRADGVPLYAIETVRTMLDQGMVNTRETGGRRLTGLATEVVSTTPASLQVLVSSRLDALPVADRMVLQDASVLGAVFDRDDVLVLSGMNSTDLDASLAHLTQRDLVRAITDRFSPHTGQYAFVQSVVRQVAYELLSRRDRIDRHVRIANAMMDEEVMSDRAAVVAQHLTDAIALTTDNDPLRVALADQRTRWLERAGDRARSVGALTDAFRLYDLALEHVDDREVRNRLSIHAAQLANLLGWFDLAISRVQAVTDPDPTALAQAISVESRVLRNLGRGEESVEVLQRFPTPESLQGVSPNAASEIAVLWAGAGYDGLSDQDGAVWSEWALRWAVLAEDPELITNALNCFSLLLGYRPGMGILLRLFVDETVRIAREHHLPRPLLRGLTNQAVIATGWDLQRTIDLNREVVQRQIQFNVIDWTYVSEFNLCNALWLAGGWDECVQVEQNRPQPEGDVSPMEYSVVKIAGVLVAQARGQVTIPDDWSDSTFNDVPMRHVACVAHFMTGITQWLSGDTAAACTVHQAAHGLYALQGMLDEFVYFWPLSLDIAVQARDWDLARDILAMVEHEPAPSVGPFLRAAMLAWRGTLNSLDPTARVTDDLIEADLRGGIDGLEAFGAVPYRARTQATLGQWLIAHDRVDEGREQVLAAAATYRDLGAIRWLSDLPEEFRHLSAS